jgi:hypothetical protein
MSKVLGRVIFVIFIWLFSLRYYLECLDLTERSEKLTINIAFWAMTVFAVKELFSLVMAKLKEKRKDGLFNENIIVKTICDKRTHLLVAVVVYIILIPLIGFYITSFVAFCAFSFILGTRSPIKMILPGGIIMVLIYAIFSVLLQLRLPGGLLM